MAGAGSLIDVFDIRFRHRRQRRADLIPRIAEQIEFFSVGDSHDRSLGQQHESSRV